MPAITNASGSPTVDPTAANKALVLDYIENVLNGGDIDRIDILFGAMLAPKVREIATMLRAAFPDLHETVHTIICQGDTVAARWTFCGTQHGKFLDLEPTGNKVEFAGLSMYYIRDGRIDDDIAVLDLLKAVKQLGATIVPPTVPAGLASNE